MKLKLLFLLLVLSANCFARSENIKIEISIKENNWWKISAKNLLEISVTNLSDISLDKKVENVRLVFSKCPTAKRCNVRGDNFTTNANFENRTLPKNEIYKFVVDLTDLYWVDPVSSSYDFSQPKNFEVVPFSNNLLYADVIISTNDSTSNSDTLKSQTYKTYKSNEIVFERKLKSPN